MKSSAPMFLQKLFDMLHAMPPFLGGWCHGGSAFEISAPLEFARLVLPQYFKHSKYTSFVRQLNFYGFVKGAKVSDVATSVVFQHVHFVQHKPHLMRRIKRKTNHSNEAFNQDAAEAVDELRRDVEEIKATLSGLDAQLKQLQEVVKVTMTLLEPFQFKPPPPLHQELLEEAIAYYMPARSEDDDWSRSSKSMEAQFEEDVARNPYSIETWTSYLNLLHTKPSGHRLSKERVALFRRALSYVPLSYKLWKRFLDESYALVRGLRIDLPELVELTLLYEDALVHLHKMPRIWLQYLSLLDHLRWGTRTRRVFDRALRALPITQHKRIWGPYLAFIHAQGVASTAIRVYRRFLMFDPSGREEYVRYLLSMELWEEASIQLVHVLNLPHPPSSRHALWMELCSLISSHPDDISSALNVDAILRSGVHLFSDEVGRFWCALATYYMRLGMFESARDVYEEGLVSREGIKFEGDPTSPELSRTLHLYEDLAERRPLLLNAVYLRQNPHSVAHWHQRIALTSTTTTSTSTTTTTPSPILIVQTYTEALKTIDSTLAVGALSSLWISFASFYEAHDDVANARAVFEKARHRLASSFRSLDERAAIVCAQIELELRHGAFDAALEFARAACRQKPVMRSLKLWHLRVDLEESLGDVPSTRSAYEDLIDLKLATPVLVLQFTAYLETHEYFEDAFHVYEKAVQLFPAFPHAKPIWTAYLAAFTHRYQGTKLERARDLYDQVLNVAPVADLADFYRQYATLEEKYGLWRNAQTIYERT
ncbi:hypothetical protein DYB38_011150 [Aphanomyces astaci]|uniref:HSF-type DNA-binding domain-containing protein n=1 Tax=Aphanomyces astaci TaxID=112090 RepID=A0A397D7J8_APHAT|nr:hypothetical protein DYB38_011150 [Aphanomyces astaci]